MAPQRGGNRSGNLRKANHLKLNKSDHVRLVQIVKPPQDAAGAQRTIKAGLSLRPCGVLRRFDFPILVAQI